MRVETIGDATLIVGDVRAGLASLPDGSVQCVVTSPPYWGLRDYGLPTTTWPDGWVGRHGLEPTPQMYVEHEVMIFADVRRVLRDDGTLWLNLGDSYAGSGKGPSNLPGTDRTHRNMSRIHGAPSHWISTPSGMKPKDLTGIPWRVAFALQADGWYLRQDIIWSKPNPMPESVRDRCTKSHEYLFLLSKSKRYYYDQDAIAEPVAASSVARLAQDVASQNGSERVPGKTNGTMKAVVRSGNKDRTMDHMNGKHGVGHGVPWEGSMRNKRSVWQVTTQPYAQAHFATFPPKLIEPCILAGSRPGDTVLDPFGGSGTTAGVALEHGRKAILIELSDEYAKLVPERIRSIVKEPDQIRMFDT